VAILLGYICEQVCSTQAEDTLWLQLVLPGKQQHFQYLPKPWNILSTEEQQPMSKSFLICTFLKLKFDNNLAV